MTVHPARIATLANVLGYQAVWFACIAGASRGLVWPGVLASLLFVSATLWRGGRWREDLRTVAVALPLGFGMDSLFVAAGWLAYEPAGPWPMAAPVWIAALWLSFAMTLNHSLALLRKHVAVAALLGAVGGPLAYWGAASGFGVLSFGPPALVASLAVGAAWAVLLPTILVLDSRAAQRTALA